MLDEYHTSNVTSPRFEVALDAIEGHYFLLKTNETKEDLEEYEQSHQRYKEDRSELLSRSEKPVSSLLVRATCPKGHLDDEPFDALIESLSNLDTLRHVDDTQQDSQKSTAANQKPNHNQRLNLGASVVGASSGLATPMGVAMLPRQYDSKPGLVDSVAFTVISGIASLGYASCNFFTSSTRPTVEKETEQECDLSEKQKPN